MSEPVPEGSRPYGPILLIALAVVAFALSRLPSMQGPEAAVLALGAPFVLMVLAIRQLRGVGRDVGIGALVIAGLVLAGAELEIERTMFPPPPLAEATISTNAPDAALPIPERAREVVVEAHAKLGHGAGSAEGSYELELERDGHKQLVSGGFQKSVSATRMSRRRAPSGGSTHVVDVDRHEIVLAGNGPVHAHLTQLTGSIGSAMDIRLRPALPGGSSLDIALIVLAVAALVIELVGVRRGARNNFGTFVTAIVVLALYLHRRFSPTDPLAGVTAAVLVATLLAAGVALVLLLARRTALAREASS